MIITERKCHETLAGIMRCELVADHHGEHRHTSGDDTVVRWGPKPCECHIDPKCDKHQLTTKRAVFHQDPAAERRVIKAYE